MDHGDSPEDFESGERPEGVDGEFEKELTDGLSDEIPVFGRVRRVYKLIHRRITQPYRQEISRRIKVEKTLLGTLENQKNHIDLLREYIAELEAQLKR